MISLREKIKVGKLTEPYADMRTLGVYGDAKTSLLFNYRRVKDRLNQIRNATIDIFGNPITSARALRGIRF